MLRKLSLFACAVSVLLSLSGCVALVAGAAGGAGTAVWLSGKLTQEVNVSFERSVSAVESALKSLNLTVVKKTTKKDIAQIINRYTDGKTLWVDIRPINVSVTRIDVRVGVTGDEDAARKIMLTIKRYL